MQITSIQAKTTNLTIQPAKKVSRGYYDPADVNKDGVVSGAEALAYALAHPQPGAHRTANASAIHTTQTSSLQSQATYTQRATTRRTAQYQHGLLDLQA